MDDRDEKGKFITGHEGVGGRPKGSHSINDTLRKYLDMKVKDVDPALIELLTGKQSKTFVKKYGNMLVKDAYAMMVIRRALSGDPTHSIQLWQQMEGKPVQNVNLGGQNGENPIDVKLTDFTKVVSANDIDNKPKEDKETETEEDRKSENYEE